MPRRAPAVGVTFLCLRLAVSAPAQAQDHLVSAADISSRFARAAADRRAALATLEGILYSPLGRQATSRVGLDPDRVRAGLSHLTDTEADDLAARARALGIDPPAGGLNGAQITLIVVGGVLFAFAFLYAVFWFAGVGCDDSCST